MAYSTRDVDGHEVDWYFDQARDNRTSKPRTAVTMPEWIHPGSFVGAQTLQFVALNYGDATAKAIDDASGPCPVCGLHTYGSVECDRCQYPDDGSLNAADDADSAEGPAVAMVGSIPGDDGRGVQIVELEF